MEYVAGRRRAVETQVRSPGSILKVLHVSRQEICQMNQFKEKSIEVQVFCHIHDLHKS